MKKLFLISVLLLSVGMLTGCNTVRGVGEDVSTTGDMIQGSTGY